MYRFAACHCTVLALPYRSAISLNVCVTSDASDVVSVALMLWD